MRIYLVVQVVLVVAMGCSMKKNNGSKATGTTAFILADTTGEWNRRVEQEFILSKQDVEQQLLQKSVAYTPEDFERWEKRNWLEFKVVGGEKRYFKRSVSNLVLMLEREQGEKTESGLINSHLTNVCLQSAEDEIANRARLGDFVGSSKLFHITYRLTVDANAVPPGEVVRCWLPFPREDHPLQTDVVLEQASAAEYVVSPQDVLHRTIYLEAIARRNEPVEFMVRYRFCSRSVYEDVSKITLEPYFTDDSTYLQYTAEESPHIVFTSRVRTLSDSIVGEEKDPRQKVRRIYHWINSNIPWAGALEYGVMENIPEYVLRNRRGDCGMQTFLMMSMLRYQGIPVRWLSGWMLHPGETNLHDWCEVYFEGKGWVPLDMSFGLLPSDTPSIREFYISGMDPYRLLVNRGVAGELTPSKWYKRSEPFDFQRGEVEWRGGNLYFDQWNYFMEVEAVEGPF